MSTVLCGTRPIQARSETKISSTHEICPFVVLAQDTAIRRTKHQTPYGVTISVRAMGIKFTPLIILGDVEMG